MAAKSARRDRTKEAHWIRVIKKWEKSGQSIRFFCREEGHAEARFHWWRKTLTRRGLVFAPKHEDSPIRPVPFLPLRLKTSPEPSLLEKGPLLPIEVVFDNGYRIRVCVFRGNPDTDSNPFRTLIPIQSGQRFQSNPDTDSGQSGPPRRAPQGRVVNL
jgi:hypothetical protein